MKVLDSTQGSCLFDTKDLNFKNSQPPPLHKHTLVQKVSAMRKVWHQKHKSVNVTNYTTEESLEDISVGVRIFGMEPKISHPQHG